MNVMMTADLKITSRKVFCDDFSFGRKGNFCFGAEKKYAETHTKHFFLRNFVKISCAFRFAHY